MTERRLYYDDAYLREFEARIVDLADDGRRVYLDRTSFYPTSGGQPSDRGTLNGAPVVDVVDEVERIAHLLGEPVAAGAVQGQIDWLRRFDHMQQHTGQHLLSAVLHELFDVPTLSFHLGSEVSTIDVAAPALTAEQLRAAELRANEAVFECRSVEVSYEEAATADGLRKASDRSGTLRIVTIAGLDRSACGGTHVRSTGEIGAILLRKLDKVRGNVRIEFVCGLRAVRQARADYEALTRTAQVFSSTLEEVPALARAAQTKLADSDKGRKKLASELALLRGKALYDQTEVQADGFRRAHLRVETISDEIRSQARGFTEAPRALLVVTSAHPVSILVAVSADSSVHAGNVVAEVAKNLGGRGGGNARMAQASLPSADAMHEAIATLGL